MKAVVTDLVDNDNPALRAAVGRLAVLLAGQLEAVARSLDGGRASPWQLCAICARLDKLRAEVEWLRRDVSNLKKPADDDDGV